MLLWLALSFTLFKERRKNAPMMGICLWLFFARTQIVGYLQTLSMFRDAPWHTVQSMVIGHGLSPEYWARERNARFCSSNVAPAVFPDASACSVTSLFNHYIE